MQPSRGTGVLTRIEGGESKPAVATHAPLGTAPPVPAAPVRHRIGWVAKVVAAVGVLVLVIAALWTPVAVPKLVKFPTNTNVTVAYSGSLVTYVNAKTGAALTTPQAVNLMVTRHIRALPAESSSSVALVKETITVRAGSIHSTEVNVYALNRRTMQSVNDPRAYTFVPGNNPNRYSSYYITLPMGLTSTTKLPIWKPESGTTYLLHPVATGTAGTPSTLDGVGVTWFEGTIPMTLAPAYELSSLKARGFPLSLTPAQVEAQLTAAGISISRLSTGLLPVLTKSQLSTLLALLGKPVSLQYYIFGTGLVAAEPQTGTIMKLQNVIDGVAVRADPAPLDTMISILSLHTNVAGVPQAVAAMRHMVAAAPQPVYELRYTETPAAVATSASLASSQIRKLNLARLYLPIGLGVLGILLLVPFTVQVVRRRRPALEVPEPGRTGRTYHEHPKAA